MATKYLHPIPPPTDPKLFSVYRIYEQGRMLITKICGQIGVKR